MDAIAHGLGMDPVELRLKNLCREGEPILSTQPLRAVRVRETMEAALKASGYWQKKGRLGPNRGIGVANLFHVTGFLSSSALGPGQRGRHGHDHYRRHRHRHRHAYRPAPDCGRGARHSMWTACASRSPIRTPHPTIPARSPAARPTTPAMPCGWRPSRCEDRLARRGRVDPGLRARGDRDRGRLGCAAQPAREQVWPFADAVAIALYVTGGPLLGSGSWLAAGPFPQPVGDGYAQGPVGTFLFGTHVAEVEVDPETGKTRVLQLHRLPRRRQGAESSRRDRPDRGRAGPGHRQRPLRGAPGRTGPNCQPLFCGLPHPDGA